MRVLLFLTLLAKHAQVQSVQFPHLVDAPLPDPDDPVMAGYDLVAYHNLTAEQNGVIGSVDISHKHSNGYVYYFSTEENRNAFIANPERYLPKYGGFCAWGVAWEYPDKGWPWAADHMGPPCGPSDGWAILDGSLYCSIWRNYQNDFNENREEGIRLADKRWIEFYGSLSAGPQNNGCYAWNWQECHARSIYKPDTTEKGEQPPPQPTPQPTPSPIADASALFSEERTKTWSSDRTAMDGIITWKWTLEDVASVAPNLIVDIAATDVASDEYVAFGVAEQLMQGPLVVCSETPETGGGFTLEPRADSPVSSSCTTLLGSGMGTTLPEVDPVKPTVLSSSRNATHYTVRFTASLFACWANPKVPARVLFARGKISGNGAPQPHVNNGQHREAVTGIEFLSVVDGYDVEVDREEAPIPAQLEPLPARALWEPIEGQGGATSILDGRVRVAYKLFRHDGIELVRIELQNVEFVSEETYIGFGFSENVMSGLVMTCAPRMTEGTLTDPIAMTATCHQWRGLGTNLLPRYVTDPGGWFLTDVTSNGTHVNYTLDGRVHEVVEGGSQTTPLSPDNLRAICAIGTSAADSGAPLMHQVRDRAAFQLEGLATVDDVNKLETSSANQLTGILGVVLSALLFPILW